ncbi:DUF2461 domain-containing protein [Streptomyces olivaceus]|uniref:DUF2461 domain-containing protein n=1 Tax=Streptomyces olivaceus TaxID=47716 RepID=A0ABS7WEC4_STROV|nr:DUF2461 family protein [Streptomyces olivaceus]MBZ6093475.1 DUF2461 domain-containing protein [Streptomyces olivaceus]MBZ6100408.1 DUF2461 domain-containing protein [Streptomyces olivaceus]MBZ6121572.1 DUF2461 domain-containing protein [Streptomyces olivaceus]MBZ6156308.1 DUF2461 domain-containing protein [Streptomyces olivaceus]MBZ6302834.1 DUF2461 domain-containing protein [Streptomyces olivaceus]
MSGAFNGWTEQAFEVLLRLEGDPPPEVRESLRKERELHVRQPMIALLNTVADAVPALDDFSVWGFHKESRWWRHQGAVIRIARQVEIGLRFDLDGLHLKAGWHYPDPVQVPRYRAAVAAESSGARLADLVGTLQTRGYEVTGDLMKRMPRGLPADHPRACLLRHRSLLAARPLAGDDVALTLATVDRVLEAAHELTPLLSWLGRHVAATARTPPPHVRR